MLDTSTRFSAPVMAPSLELIRAEILRLGAPAAEMKSAFAFVASEASHDPRAYQALPPRVRRLVDLIAVAGHEVSDLLFHNAPESPAYA